MYPIIAKGVVTLGPIVNPPNPQGEVVVPDVAQGFFLHPAVDNDTHVLLTREGGLTHAGHITYTSEPGRIDVYSDNALDTGRVRWALVGTDDV